MRAARQVVARWPHHLVHRGNNRRRLFSYPCDYRRFLRFVEDAAKERCTIQALCLLPNHVHLIATPSTAEALGAFVHSFAQRYAQYRNRRRKSSGKLFEERYWSIAVRTPFHLAVATMYIDRNPVAAGIKSDPSLYPWSTFRLHSETGDPEPTILRMWKPSDWYRDLGKSPSVRAAEYRRHYQVYAATALARQQEEFFAKLERKKRREPRVERPDRSSAR